MKTLLLITLIFLATGIDWDHLMFNEERTMEIIKTKLEPQQNGIQLTAEFNNGLIIKALVQKGKVISNNYSAQGKIQQALVEYTNNLPNLNWVSKATLESIIIEGVTLADSRSTIIYASRVTFIDSGIQYDLPLNEFINNYKIIQ